MKSARHRPAVRTSPDLTRVLALPSREPPDLGGVEGRALVALWNRRLRITNPECECAAMGRACVDTLRPVQAWALHEAARVGGLLAPVGVGHGKTALNFLAPAVVRDCRRAVLLIPPNLRDQLLREYNLWRQHFRVPSLVMDDGRGWVVPGSPVVHVVPYSLLSRPESTLLLEELAPDLIVADEAHRLRYWERAGAGRFFRYLADHDGVRFCAWSGTLTGRSVADYAHLAAAALGDGSPLPHDPNVTAEWDGALGPHDYPSPPGALEKLGVPAREGFRRRLVTTLGVVATSDSSAGASIVFRERVTEMPDEVEAALRDVRRTWCRPDGEELVEKIEHWACLQQLACGFYYRWVFPRGEDAGTVDEWRAARKAWNRELREMLKCRAPHLDSPALLEAAARRHHSSYDGPLPCWASSSWARWQDVRDTVHPETEAVWVDDWLARDAAEWLRAERGIVWYEHAAFGESVARLAGEPCYGGGTDVSLADKRRGVVLSIDAHGTGTDGLQRRYSKMLVANVPSSGTRWEQLIGRLHRIGFEGDEVETFVHRHASEVRDALEMARRQAAYVQETTGAAQKLVMATYEF